MTTKPVPPVHPDEQIRLDKITEIKAKMEGANEKRITHYNSFWHRMRGMSRSRASHELNCEINALEGSLKYLEEWKVITDRLGSPTRGKKSQFLLTKVLQHTRNGMILQLRTRLTGSTSYRLETPAAGLPCGSNGEVSLDFYSPEYANLELAEDTARRVARQFAHITDLSNIGDE